MNITSLAQPTDSRYYELRIYYCHPGKLQDLQNRFAHHTTQLFEKHGMQNIGYWLPVENKDSALYYVLAYPSAAARDSSWKAFNADPEWNQVRTASETNGKIVARVQSVFMNAAAFSPSIKDSKAKTPRLFELRTYTCLPGKLPDLLTRFQDHTCKLFTKHGITHIAYWTSIAHDSIPSKLVYIIAHKDSSAAKQSWDAFDHDPQWRTVKTASEKNGRIVDKIEAVFLTPLPFSKIQ